MLAEHYLEGDHDRPRMERLARELVANEEHVLGEFDRRFTDPRQAAVRVAQETREKRRSCSVANGPMSRGHVRHSQTNREVCRQSELVERNVIAAARSSGVSLVVYTSLLHADHSPLNVAENHRRTEAMLAEAGVPFALLRNSWYTENLTISLPAALADNVLLVAPEPDASRRPRGLTMPPPPR